jgi:MinD superfamily P-loop ATPase
MYLCGLNQDNVGSVEEVKLANPHLIDSKALEIGQSSNRHMFDVLILKELEPQSYLLAAVQGHLMQFFILDTTPGLQQAVISKIVMGDDCFSQPMSISRFVFF